MKSTQKKPNNGENRKNQWQIPERSQVFLTPGAQKELEEAQKRGETLKVKTDRAPAAQKKPNVAAPSAPPSPESGAKPATVKKQVQTPAKREEPMQPLSLRDAVFAELKDRAQAIRMGIQVNSEDIIRGVICGCLMMLFALLQTTFFARFAPFGKVPDLMLVFVISIGVYEGEKWGSIVGLVAAFVIQALGSSGIGPELLPLVYMPCGCAAGLLSKYYLRHTLPVNAVYIAVAAFLKSIVTVITALLVLDATFADIITKIVIPEYFSTLVVSPIPLFAVWISFKKFHKTRAERTDSRSE